MAEDLIRYDILAQDALRGVVRKVLSEVARTGLPGDHHFFITFGTRAAGVRVSSRLLAQYPQDMTIVLQHQYWDLNVTEHAVEVGLSFNNVPERLLIPFTAITAFADPSVQFGLQFDIAKTAVEAEEDEAAADEPVTPISRTPTTAPAPAPAPLPAAAAAESDKDEPGEETPAPAAEVVSLDAFRKKH